MVRIYSSSTNFLTVKHRLPPVAWHLYSTSNDPGRGDPCLPRSHRRTLHGAEPALGAGGSRAEALDRGEDESGVTRTGPTILRPPNRGLLHVYGRVYRIYRLLPLGVIDDTTDPTDPQVVKVTWRKSPRVFGRFSIICKWIIPSSPSSHIDRRLVD